MIFSVADIENDPAFGPALRYWRSKADDHGGLPPRSALDPLDLPPALLPSIILVEFIDGAADARYRLMGTQISTRMKSELTGLLVSKAFGAPGWRAYLLAMSRELIESKRPLYTEHKSPVARPPYGLPHVIRRLIMPLSADGETVDMAFGVQLFEGASPDASAGSLYFQVVDTSFLPEIGRFQL
jgi:hypothetical protein